MTSVSVVLCTRDRPDDLVRAFRAVLLSDFKEFELVIVDQSSTDESSNRLMEVAVADPRVRWIRDRRVGASRARNLGALEAAGNLLVFTDDDCEPEPAWLRTMVENFGSSDTGIAFGSVMPAEHQAPAGFIVGYLPSKMKSLHGRLGKLSDGGIGANMAVTRSVFSLVGGFDEELGPGAYFPSCEDGDIAYRILRKGYTLKHIPQARVHHHGLRRWSDGRDFSRRTFIGVGAAYMKYVRRGDLVAGLLLIQQFSFSIAEIGRALLRMRRPIGLIRLLGLIAGVKRSFELDVNPLNLKYKPA